MNTKELLKTVDHTLLAQTATWEDIRNICYEGIAYNTASVCIPQYFVKPAVEYIAGEGVNLPVCTVIGFPNGYSFTQAKILEAKQAIELGAEEIDMVINICALKEGKADFVTEEIAAIKSAIGKKVLKVIVEACLLTHEEKIIACKAVTESGADFIKTSTGFSTGGATFEDVALFRQHVGKDVKIKAAGGINSLDDAERFIELGASRLGTSKIVKLIKNQQALGY